MEPKRDVFHAALAAAKAGELRPGYLVYVFPAFTMAMRA